MKMLFILSMVLAGSLVATSAYSQVHLSVSFEKDYPGASYYTYPAWNGHYRDRVYYEHYHPVFERDHRAYFHGRTFDRARYDREHHRGGRGHGPIRRDHRNDHRH